MHFVLPTDLYLCWPIPSLASLPSYLFSQTYLPSLVHLTTYIINVDDQILLGGEGDFIFYNHG
jgi:hypothetical protein